MNAYRIFSKMKTNLAQADHPAPRAGSGAITRTKKSPSLYKSPTPARPPRSNVPQSSQSARSIKPKKRTHSQKPAAPPSNKDRSLSPNDSFNPFKAQKLNLSGIQFESSRLNKSSNSMVTDQEAYYQPNTVREGPTTLNPAANLFKPLQPLRKKPSLASNRGTPNSSFHQYPDQQQESVHRYESSQVYPEQHYDIIASHQSSMPSGSVTDRAAYHPHDNFFGLNSGETGDGIQNQLQSEQQPVDQNNFFSGTFASKDGAQTLRESKPVQKKISPPVTPPSANSVKGKPPPSISSVASRKKKLTHGIKRGGNLRNFMFRPSEARKPDINVEELEAKQKLLQERQEKLERQNKQFIRNRKLGSLVRRELMRSDQVKIVSFQRWKEVLIQLSIENKYSSQLEESNVNYALFKKYQEDFSSRQINKFSLDKDGSLIKPKIGERMLLAEVTAAYDTLKSSMSRTMIENQRLEASIKRTKLLSLLRMWKNKERIRIGLAWIRWVASRELKFIASGRKQAAQERAVRKLNLIAQKKTRTFLLRWAAFMRIHKRVRKLVSQEISRLERDEQNTKDAYSLNTSPSSPDPVLSLVNSLSVLEVLSENRELKETVHILQKELIHAGVAGSQVQHLSHPRADPKIIALRKILGITLMRSVLNRPVMRFWKNLQYVSIK